MIYETGIRKEKDIYLKILKSEIQCCEICLQAIWSLEKYFKTKIRKSNYNIYMIKRKVNGMSYIDKCEGGMDQNSK